MKIILKSRPSKKAEANKIDIHMNKNEFISILLSERDKFEQLLNRVGYTRNMALKGVTGRWSTKDILACIWVYEQFISDRMHEIENDQPYTPCKTEIALDSFLDEFGYPDLGSPLLDEDTPNEWVVERYKTVPLDELVAQELEAFASIVTTLGSMSESRINSHNLYNRIAKHSIEKYRRYAREIKHWSRVNGIKIS